MRLDSTGRRNLRAVLDNAPPDSEQTLFFFSVRTGQKNYSMQLSKADAQRLLSRDCSTDTVLAILSKAQWTTTDDKTPRALPHPRMRLLARRVMFQVNAMRVDTIPYSRTALNVNSGDTFQGFQSGTAGQCVRAGARSKYSCEFDRRPLVASVAPPAPGAFKHTL